MKNDLYDTRRKNLMVLRDKYALEGHSQKSFAEMLNIGPSLFSQIISPSASNQGKNITDDRARQIEAVLDLTTGSLDKTMVNFDENTKTLVAEAATMYFEYLLEDWKANKVDLQHCHVDPSDFQRGLKTVLELSIEKVQTRVDLERLKRLDTSLTPDLFG